VAAAAPTAAPSATKISALDFRNAMRKLWEDHITFTRLYIISVAHDLPDKDATAQRLLANQADIGNAIKPFYGDAAGDQLTALLKDHILGAADLLSAAKAGDKAKVDAASTKWYQNANDIAAFLSRANEKNWPLPAMQEAMKTHLDQTLKEAVDRLQGKYADDIKDYDAVHTHILEMADVLSNGIIAQFPDKFDTRANAKEIDLRLAMRKLWEDHITWTRLYIISAAHALPDKDATAQRLLANQTDIGNAIKTYYGNDAGDKLTALLKDHILGAADLLAAAKAGDKAKVDAASTKWYANADDIATFLNGANPKNWPLAAMKEAMKAHLDQTLKEAVDRLQGKYADDIKDYDAVHAHILDMADALSAGVIAQFSDKFK
jgi:nicotinamidase-related amidase